MNGNSRIVKHGIISEYKIVNNSTYFKYGIKCFMKFLSKLQDELIE